MIQTPPPADQPKKSRWLLPLLRGVLVVTVLAAALVFSSNARSGAHAASVTKPASSLELTQDTTTILRASRNSAGGCWVFTSYLTYGTLGHKNEMWLKVVTTWCYNYVIVTSHKTSWSWGVTALGAGDGWGWIVNPYYSFNCYNAADNAYRPCSGNHEWTQETFINGFLKEEAQLTIDQYEIYTGWSNNTFHTRTCPGGC
jgi:hypothetical protein